MKGWYALLLVLAINACFWAALLAAVLWRMYCCGLR